MSAKKRLEQRKTRTREHIIADLAVNFFERYVLLCGYSLERVQHDYGIVLFMTTYNDKGEVESGQILFQVKATDLLKLLKDEKSVSFQLDRRDLKLWLREPDPVILIIYDAKSDKAFWLYVQAYFEMKRDIHLFTAPGKATVHIPVSNRLNRRAVEKFAKFRDNVLAQIEVKIRHYA